MCFWYVLTAPPQSNCIKSGLSKSVPQPRSEPQICSQSRAWILTAHQTPSNFTFSFRSSPTTQPVLLNIKVPPAASHQRPDPSRYQIANGAGGINVLALWRRFGRERVECLHVI